jgi:hypothetical protein
MPALVHNAPCLAMRDCPDDLVRMRAFLESQAVESLFRVSRKAADAIEGR